MHCAAALSAPPGGHARRICCTSCALGPVQVLERTQNVDYRIPNSPRISGPCRDFLSHLLVADPDQRLSTAAIMEHPWFCQGLPAGVKSLNDECLRLKVPWLFLSTHRRS